ncbi:hypothetical protein ElyMa_006601100 [Elysia marginata]|uniref:L-Fucosyltransferase n=1 Tax=Elysia marginata TaxID=1093978 RepID=A0AAV4IJ19_9GAST|nr:hypothetical protein ElyMa_006601100 [Elysia marginata]
MARPTAVLVVILTLCMCSVLVSVYYVHSVSLATPLDVMRANRMVLLRDKRLAADDDGITSSEAKRGHHVLPPPGLNISGVQDVVNPPVLNDIDIAVHIENKKAKQQQQQQQTTKKKHKKLRKEDMWPSREKVYKQRKAFVPLAEQIYHNPERTRANWKGERYIVYLCHSNLTCAGWGDRQHGIFSVYLISLVTNRTFKVDMQSPCPLSKLYHPRLVNWKLNQSELEGLSSIHLYALNDRQFRDSVKTIDFDKEYPQDVLYLTTNYDYFYNLKVNPNYKDIFRQKVRGKPRPILFADLWQGIFKINKRVSRKISPALDLAHPSKSHKLVCAHVRFGRNPTIPNDGDIRNTLTTIKPFWKFMERHSDPDKYRMFIASDWQGFQEKVRSVYPDLLVFVSGDIVHIDKLRSYFHVGQKGKNSSISSLGPVDECTGFEKVIADQYVLSKCDVLLLTYSVFGKAAAYMRRSNDDLYLLENGTIKPLKLFNERNL